jgi:hypothetical protein
VQFTCEQNAGIVRLVYGCKSDPVLQDSSATRLTCASSGFPRSVFRARFSARSDGLRTSWLAPPHASQARPSSLTRCSGWQRSDPPVLITFLVALRVTVLGAEWEVDFEQTWEPFFDADLGHSSTRGLFARVHG